MSTSSTARSTLRLLRAIVVLGMVLGLLTPLFQATPSYADNVASGDGVTTPSPSPTSLNFGAVCANATVSKVVFIAINRNGAAGSTNVFKDGSQVTVSVGSGSATGLSASVPASPGNVITLPPNWGDMDNNTLSVSKVQTTVTFAAGASATNFTGSVPYTASGVNSSNGSVSRTLTLAVTANVVQCDTTAPTLSLPASMTVEATSAAGAMVTFNATATDANPTNPTVTCTPASGSTFPIGPTTVNCAATDAAGNRATGSFTITVRDTTGPVISGTPLNMAVAAEDASGATVNYTDPTATDAVNGSRPVSCQPASGSRFPLGRTTVTCTSTDTRGNTSTSTFTIDVQDQTAPVLALPNLDPVEATSGDGAAVSYIATAVDNVDGSVAATCVPPSGSTFPIGTTTVNCSATDAADNTNLGQFSVTVRDTTAPAITVPDPITAEATGANGAAVTFSASANDIVDGAITPSCSRTSGSIFALGTTTVTCAATDEHGNTASETFGVVVQDTTAPKLQLPEDQLLEATGPNGASATFSATADDIVDGAVTPTCSAESGDTFPLGTTTVNCSVTDAHGNKSKGSFTIKVQDTTAPTIATHSNITGKEATGPSGVVVTYSPPATSDIVDGAGEATCSPASGTTFALGTTPVICSAADAAGNQATNTTFTVEVVDTTAPALTLPTNITQEATSANGAAVTYSASATDLVDGSVTPSCSPVSGTNFALGNTTVNCSATDTHGNERTGSFQVTVRDTTAPSLNLPANITTVATGASSAVVTFSASASDLVDGSVAVTCTPASGSSFAVGTTTVNCSATDAHGNVTRGSFNVTVNYNWTGFFQPVDNLPTENVLKAGSAVPIKFSLGGNQGLTIMASGYPKSVAYTCGTGAGDAVEETVTAGGSSLSYDATTGQYVYVWKTDKTWAGTCRQFQMKLSDGTTHSANFKFTR